MADGKVKLVCSHCGEKEMFFKMEGVNFCGSCAKKVDDEPNGAAAPSTPAPATPAPAAAPPTPATPATEDKQLNERQRVLEREKKRVQELKARRNSNTPPPAAALAASPSKGVLSPREDEDIPPPPPDEVPPPSFDEFTKIAEPVIKRSSSKTDMNSTTPTKKTSKTPVDSKGDELPVAKRPSSKRIPLDSKKDFGPPPSAEDLKKEASIDPKIVAQIERRVREEIIKQTDNEMSIVQMQHEDEIKEKDQRIRVWEKKEQEWISTKRSLETTLDEVMGNFEATVTEYTQRKGQDLAQIGLLETEIQRLRAQVSAAEVERQAVAVKLGQLATHAETSTGQIQERDDKIAQLTKDLDAAKLFIEQLRARAETKLKSAQQQFTLVQKDAADKTSQVRALQTEVTTLRESTAVLQAKYGTAEAQRMQATEQFAILERSYREMEARAGELSGALTASQQELQTLRRQATELMTANSIYKEQITTANEELRTLKADARALANISEEHKKMSLQLQTLSKDNKELKSRIFDAMETEKKLRAQLTAVIGGKVDSSASPQLALLESQYKEAAARLSETQAALAAKDTENKELVTICDELIKECEMLKRKAGIA